jgi:hypothetical protein
LLEALLVVGFRRGLAVGVMSLAVGVVSLTVGVVSLGFSGELFGVAGRTVDGEWLIELGRRNGEVRGLLKESGDGL